MKNKLKSIINIPFLACLFILLLNDFYLKAEYHNWLTGKLSDFSGLFVFVVFWTALFSNKKQVIYFSTALLFVIWKSPYSQSFIDFFSQNFYPIGRVVDVTDLVALSILPIAFYYEPNRNIRLKIDPIPFALLSVFSFCATSVSPPVQIFKQPQYLLFKSGVVNFENNRWPTEYNILYRDSFVIVDIRQIIIHKKPPLNDDFHKVQILKDIELRLLRKSMDVYRARKTPIDYEALRDTLTVSGTTSVILKLDNAITDHLNFNGTRLDGDYKRFLNDTTLIVEGQYENGIEDAIWTYYDTKSQIVSKKYFKHGELTKTEAFEDDKLKSYREFKTRHEIVIDKYFHLSILLLLMVGLLIKLYLNFKKSNDKDIIQVSSFYKIAGALTFPFVTFILAQIFSSLIPNSSSSSNLFGPGMIFTEVILVYIVILPLFLLIFYFLKLRNRFDWIYYILLLSLGIALVEEWNYLEALM